eukprot:CAMPEP_0194319392 /NCGR_PEP_ID=MMETSP0171-20130528/15842_1 /TAXON_ID=218684 /ORGANISM="Corethron pennatum, Strain L29A3" /LENGTH=438 /DNA_ID=CAMNT_0039076589 /DNA_START=219 /DNA_END=1536 /DNA_ORIENTATION=+
MITFLRQAGFAAVLLRFRIATSLSDGSNAGSYDIRDVTDIDATELLEFEEKFHMETMDARRSLQSCSQQTKQKAIYASFEFEPSLKDEPALDVIGDVYWDDIDDLRAFGGRGIFHAFPVGFGSGLPGGYFGPQATGAGSEDVEQVLFSLWDQKRYGEEGWLPALPVVGGDIEDCRTFSASDNPGRACCKRNCNDCSQSQTTGTQCKVFIPARSGTHLRLNAYRVDTDQSMAYEGTTWTGDVWQVDVWDVAAGRRYPVGRQLLAGASGSGIDRLSNFLEHIGCTPCDSFDQYTSRAGPWVLKTVSGAETRLVGASSKFTLENPPYICTNHAVESSAGPPFIEFSSGPSVPYLKGDGTWDKALYTCPEDQCNNPCDNPEDPKVMMLPCSDDPNTIFLGTKTCAWLNKQNRNAMCIKYASAECPDIAGGYVAAAIHPLPNF